MKIEGASRAGEIPLGGEPVTSTGGRVMPAEGGVDVLEELHLHVVRREGKRLVTGHAFVVQGAKGGGTLHAEHLAKAVEEKSFEQCENHLDLLVRVTAPALWVRVGPGPAPRSA